MGYFEFIANILLLKKQQTEKCFRNIGLNHTLKGQDQITKRV